MPIYEYQCKSCGMKRDFLRKMSDPPLTTCPECGKETMQKMLTAAGFQLKGTGWYVTDFKDGGKAVVPPPAAGGDNKGAPAAESKTESGSDSKTDAKTDSKADSKPEAKPAAKTESKSETPAPAASPAANSGS
jgi:putative FmdB family regulatory protein